MLRRDAHSELRDPVRFWTAMNDLPPARRPLAAAVSLLRRQFRNDEAPRYVTRRAGLGSLGHPRIVAIAEHSGGWIAREAKELVASGVAWAVGDAPQRSRSTTRRSSAGRCAAPTPSSRYAVAGCCAGSRPTAAGSSSPSHVSPSSRPTCSTPWAPRPPTSTWGRERAGSPPCSRDLDRASRRLAQGRLASHGAGDHRRLRRLAAGAARLTVRRGAVRPATVR